MLKFYECYITTYYNGKNVGVEYCGSCIEEENTAQNYTKKLTWENLTEDGSCYQFQIYNTRKGRVIFFLNKPFCRIREWKEEKLNIEIKYEYKEKVNVSINDILKFHNVEKAIQYLNERGLTI